MDYRTEFRVRLLAENHIGISVGTPFGEVPLLIFANWESYNVFLNTLEKFRSEYRTEIPEVFKQAFADENGIKGE